MTGGQLVDARAASAIVSHRLVAGRRYRVTDRYRSRQFGVASGPWKHRTRILEFEGPVLGELCFLQSMAGGRQRAAYIDPDDLNYVEAL